MSRRNALYLFEEIAPQAQVQGQQRLARGETRLTSWSCVKQI